MPFLRFFIFPWLCSCGLFVRTLYRRRLTLRLSLNVNSSTSLTVASNNGVAPPLISRPTSPRNPFRSPSSLNRFQNGGECTRSCNTAFAKHRPPVFTSPRPRRRGNVALSVGREGRALLRRVSNSALGKIGTRDGKGDAGAEEWGILSGGRK